MKRKARQQRVESDVNLEGDRLPANVRDLFFRSQYVQRLQSRLRSGPLQLEDLPEVRDYLLVSILLWNGHRPMVLRQMTIGDVQRGQIEVAEGDRPQGSRSYMTIAVSRHKTAKTWGAAMVSLPPYLYRELIKYLSTVRCAFQLTDTSPVFLTDRGEAIPSSSVVNR